MDKRSMSPESEIRELFDRLSAGLCTCAPGIIESFDTATCLATVRVAIKLKTSEIETTPIVKYLSQPLIERVPIVLPHSIKAGLYITVPIRKGDMCLIVFSQRAIDNVVEFGGEQNPPETEGVPGVFADLRHHDMTDAICIPSFMCEPSKIPDWADDAVEIRNTDGTVKVRVEEEQVIVNHGTTVRLTIKEDEVTILSPLTKIDGDVQINGDITVTGDTNQTGTITATVDVVGGGKHLKTHIHTDSTDAGITGTPV